MAHVKVDEKHLRHAMRMSCVGSLIGNLKMDGEHTGLMGSGLAMGEIGGFDQVLCTGKAFHFQPYIGTLYKWMSRLFCIP